MEHGMPGPTMRQLWREGRETLGAWLSIPSSICAEGVARKIGKGGFVCLDLQHGCIGYESAVPIIQAILAVGGNPIARVPWLPPNESSTVGRLLDAGCQGIIVPMVNNKHEAEAVVRACRYAPRGARSWGPLVMNMREQDYYKWAEDNIAVMPMIETAEAVDNIDEILSVPGIDCAYVGPADLGLSMGLSADPGETEGNPAFMNALQRVVDSCKRHNVIPGIHSWGSATHLKRQQGFKMVAVAHDMVAVLQGVEAEMKMAKSGAPSGGGGIYGQ